MLIASIIISIVAIFITTFTVGMLVGASLVWRIDEDEVSSRVGTLVARIKSLAVRND